MMQREKEFRGRDQGEKKKKTATVEKWWQVNEASEWGRKRYGKSFRQSISTKNILSRETAGVNEKQ